MRAIRRGIWSRVFCSELTRTRVKTARKGTPIANSAISVYAADGMESMVGCDCAVLKHRGRDGTTRQIFHSFSHKLRFFEGEKNTAVKIHLRLDEGRNFYGASRLFTQERPLGLVCFQPLKSGAFRAKSVRVRRREAEDPFGD